MKTPKAFRNQFKKSFFESMLKNTECRISKKQLEVMENDAEGYTFNAGSLNHSFYVKLNSYADVINKYKNYIFHKFYYSKGFNEFKEQVFNSPDFGFYCRIQVAKAWV